MALTLPDCKQTDFRHFRIISHVLFPGLVRSLWRVFYLKLHFELKHQIVTTWTRYKTLAATEFAYWSWAVGKGRFLAREKKNQFTFKNHNSHPRWFGIDFPNQFPPQNLFSYIFNAVDSPLSILIPIEQKDKPLTQEVFAHVFFFFPIQWETKLNVKQTGPVQGRCLTETLTRTKKHVWEYPVYQKFKDDTAILKVLAPSCFVQQV